MALTILAVVAFAQLDTGNLGNRIGLVGGLQCAGEQGRLAHGLRRQARINAAAAQNQQLFDAIAKRGIHHIGLHHQVGVNEISRKIVVGQNAAHLGSRQIHLIRFFGGKKRLHLGLVA